MLVFVRYFKSFFVINERLPEPLSTMQFSTAQRVFIAITYLQTGSLQRVRDKVAPHFPERTSPAKRTILKTVSKYRMENPDLMKKVMRSLRKRSQVCVNRNGGQVERRGQ